MIQFLTFLQKTNSSFHEPVKVLLTSHLFVSCKMAGEAAWWIHNLFLFIIFFMAVPHIVHPADDVACETLPSELHIVKGQFSAKR